jgi:hypothetical protein
MAGLIERVRLRLVVKTSTLVSLPVTPNTQEDKISLLPTKGLLLRTPAKASDASQELLQHRAIAGWDCPVPKEVEGTFILKLVASTGLEPNLRGTQSRLSVTSGRTHVLNVVRRAKSEPQKRSIHLDGVEHTPLSLPCVASETPIP